MIMNSKGLLAAAPIKHMYTDKMRSHGVSFGLGEAGYDIRIKQDIHFHPYGAPAEVVVDSKRVEGNFTLASSIEEFDMPNHLVGVVHDKSTWARKGLSVFNTVIENGWKGFLTLELVYHGQEYLHIPAGAGIAQVLFHQTFMQTSYSGKYQNQADKPVESVFSNT